MKNKQTEIENCTFAKTVLMILVILYHSMVFWNGTWFKVEPVIYKSKGLTLLSQWLNSFHIYGFTLISGYLFYYLKYEVGRYNNFKLFFKKKIKRLLVPYVFAAFVWVIPFSIILFGDGIKEIIYKFILACNPSQLWFLLMLFWVFIIFWPLGSFFRRHELAGGLFVSPFMVWD